MRDYRAELRDDRCWDADLQRVYEHTRIPLADAILQSRDELIALCEWMESVGVRSYLEIGVWTGRLVSTLHRIFDFERVAACDLGSARVFGLPIRLPYGCELFQGSSQSDEYIAWRQRLGPIDLVMIDGDHSYAGVRRDFEINRQLPHRWLGFHDICGSRDPQSAGVSRLWRELRGDKLEIVRANSEIVGATTSGMGIGIWRASQ